MKYIYYQTESTETDGVIKPPSVDFEWELMASQTIPVVSTRGNFLLVVHYWRRPV